MSSHPPSDTSHQQRSQDTFCNQRCTSSVILESAWYMNLWKPVTPRPPSRLWWGATYKVRRGWGRCGGVGGAINGFKTGTISHHHPAFIKILLIFRFGASQLKFYSMLCLLCTLCNTCPNIMIIIITVGTCQYIITTIILKLSIWIINNSDQCVEIRQCRI